MWSGETGGLRPAGPAAARPARRLQHGDQQVAHGDAHRDSAAGEAAGREEGAGPGAVRGGAVVPGAGPVSAVAWVLAVAWPPVAWPPVVWVPAVRAATAAAGSGPGGCPPLPAPRPGPPPPACRSWAVVRHPHQPEESGPLPDVELWPGESAVWRRRTWPRSSGRVEIRERLALANPDAYLPDLATSAAPTVPLT